MPSAKLSTRGRIVVPKAIRKRLGVGPGDRVDFVVQDNGDVALRPVVRHVRQLKGMLYRPGGRPVTVEEMNRAIRECGGRMP